MHDVVKPLPSDKHCQIGLDRDLEIFLELARGYRARIERWGSPVPREAAPGRRLLGDAPPPMIEMVDYVPAFSMPYLALSLHT